MINDLNDPKNYLFTKLSLLIPTMEIKQIESNVFAGIFSDIIDEKNNKCSVLMDIRDLLSDYQKTKDNTILDIYSNSLYDAYLRIKGMVVYNKSVDLNKVYPFIKPTEFFKENNDKYKNDTDSNSFIFKEINSQISIGFVEDMDESVIFISNHMIKDISKEQVIKTSFNNLKNNGWVQETKHFTTPNNSRVSLYDGDNLNITQFFISEWTSKNIGSEFYISFPDSSAAMVFLPSNNILPDKLTHDLYKFKKATLEMFSQAYDKLSDKVYKFSSSGIKVLG